jgi:hypothetical protein
MSVRDRGDGVGAVDTQAAGDREEKSGLVGPGGQWNVFVAGCAQGSACLPGPATGEQIAKMILQQERKGRR